jgi:hypothetical protein
MLTLVALTAVAGCGGSSSSPKSRAIARADAICKPLNARRNAANKAVGTLASASTLPKIAKVVPGLVAYERTAISELRALTVPASLSADWQKILGGIEQLSDNAVKLGAYARAGNVAGVTKLSHEDEQSQRELLTVAQTAGFAHCGRNV